MEDTTATSSDAGSSCDVSDSPLGDAQSSVSLPPLKRTISVMDVFPSVGFHIGGPRIEFIRVVATPYGPKTTSSTFDIDAPKDVPLSLRRILTIREEYSSSEKSPSELPENVSYSRAESSAPDVDISPADMKILEPKPIARGLFTGGMLGTAWAAFRTAWCVSDPLNRNLPLRTRLLGMSQGQGLRVATFATFCFSMDTYSGVGAEEKDWSPQQVMAESLELGVTVPQRVHIKQPLTQGSTFTYLGALAGMIASTWKIHRYPGPRVGIVQQLVGSAAIGWFFAVAGQSSSRLGAARSTNEKFAGNN